MLFGHLLTNSASIFGDIRTYWSPDAVERVTGHTLTGRASGGIIHFLNSGAASLDGTGRLKSEGEPVMKPLDRKSTRLNSSHVAISYAVFCLKKKTHFESH